MKRKILIVLSAAGVLEFDLLDSYALSWRRVSAAMLALIILFASPCRAESARVRINIAGLGTERCDVIETGHPVRTT
ncbi:MULTISPECIES: hypothetical protein [unclassified Bradyrhizobium]|uniref:hypothetical protein n=1 Tax=unclassified Bradyrhizobium TaxID=2631580 RepID=UPI001FF74FC8|nr:MULTISPECIES: hypothetical protein [unclassified Bradyrhizobium]MCK1344499.1 hypothetical protein [Bradyrhizobium sp. CW11]MCK1591081.1 hypothetical protein [Bradyrhizobium sp. 169]